MMGKKMAASKKITKGLLETLAYIQWGWYASGMVREQWLRVLRLEEIGLVKMIPRLVTRGRWAGTGMHKGFDVRPTPSGIALLKTHGLLKLDL
jgi:hypothetical protein